MRLDHLLSKEMKKSRGMGLLFGYECSWKKRRRKCTPGTGSPGCGIAAYVFTGDIPPADKSACDTTGKAALTHEYAEISGGDASGGHTRTHPEHDG